MRPHIKTMSRCDIGRADMVEEHERADLAAQPERQQAAHDEAVAQIVQPWFDQQWFIHGRSSRSFRTIMPSCGAAARMNRAAVRTAALRFRRNADVRLA
jgi:hypothetical protein